MISSIKECANFFKPDTLSVIQSLSVALLAIAFLGSLHHFHIGTTAVTALSYTGFAFACLALLIYSLKKACN